MILVDTAVWIDHLHAADARLVELLHEGRVGVHPFVIGELALGSLRNRDQTLDLLSSLPRPLTPSHDEVMALISTQQLSGEGLGLVDAHLLTSALLTPDCTLWTRDRRLARAAQKAG